MNLQKERLDQQSISHRQTREKVFCMRLRKPLGSKVSREPKSKTIQIRKELQERVEERSCHSKRG